MVIIRTKSSLEKRTTKNEKNHLSLATKNCETHSDPLFENLISKTDLAERLGVSVSWVNKMVRQNRIPYYKLGKMVKFSRSEVVAYLNKRRITP